MTLKEFNNALDADKERVNRAWNNELLNGESNNLFTEVTLSNEEFNELVIDAILGEDYYIVDPLPNCQANTIILNDIINWKEQMKTKLIGYSVISFMVGLFIGILAMV